MKKVNLTHEWTLGEIIGSGGFGTVYKAKSSLCARAVAKIIPKLAGADRELLFVNNNDLEGVRNIVPIIDSGETNSSWVLIMPMAEKSLRQHLDKTADLFSLPSAVEILSDIATSLVEIDKKGIVHRDIKPENILLLNGHWCLADFGISRYAEATTAADTRKFALSPCYAAPERWHHKRASIATDIYSLGVIAYELLAKSPPFPGPTYENFREQHLQNTPQPLANAPASIATLVHECLYKPAEARPSPTDILQRLETVRTDKPIIEGLAKLEEANSAEVMRKNEFFIRQSKQKSETERRRELFEIADEELIRFTDSLQKEIIRIASSTTPSVTSDGWVIPLGQARLEFKKAITTLQNPWGRWPPKLDVIAHASLILHIPSNEYKGRSHSLWYADAQESNHYQWFETAFMVSPLIPERFAQNPSALSPGKDSVEALGSATGSFHVAWPFTPLIAGDLDEFISRWAGWFADAANGQLRHPQSMPEQPTEGSWRR